MLKQVYFVGYFQKKDEKLHYAQMFKAEQNLFLESSFEYTRSDAQNIQYFPEILYDTTGKNTFSLHKKYINYDTVFREAYRRDYKHFIDSMKNKLQLNKIQKALLILSFVIHQFRKKYPKVSWFNISKWKQIFHTLKLRYQEKDGTLLFELKKHLFRWKFMKGYAYVSKTLKTLKIEKEALFVLWGKSYSSRILLIAYLKEHNIPYVISEYGEISGTISCSKHGIFGETCTLEEWKSLRKKPLDNTDIKYADDILAHIKNNQISTRQYDNNMFFFMKYFYENSLKIDENKRRKIIYVNGSELFSSGLYHKRWGIETHGKNPNQYLLEKVVDYFDTDKYMIIYKEHPMAISHNKNALLNPSDFPNVGFLGNMSIHDVLEISDIIITYPSKVIITSLLYSKNTFVLGDFTIPMNVPEMKYFTSRNFEDIAYMEEAHTYDSKVFTEFVARLIKYNLIVYDNTFFYKYNEEEEKTKLKHCLTSIINTEDNQ